MKITVNKSRFAAFLLTLGAVIVIAGLVYINFIQHNQLNTVEIKLKPTPTVSSISIAPTASPSAAVKATPTATLKYNPKTGVVK